MLRPKNLNCGATQALKGCYAPTTILEGHKMDEDQAKQNPEIRVITDQRLYETIFNIVQEAQAAGSVVQIITIWPSVGDGVLGGGPIKPMDCKPSGACPK